MAFGARRTGLVGLGCLLGGVTGPFAQDKPAGTWTEPPVRGAAGPQDDTADKPSAPASGSPRTGNAADRATQRADTREAARTAERDGRVERSAKLRRAQIRREAARAAEIEAVAAEAARSKQARRRERIRVAAAKPPHAHPIQTERGSASANRSHAVGQAPGSPRRQSLYAYRAYPEATPRLRYAEPRLRMAEDVPPPGYGWRRAGWGNLLGDNRARRIAEARAAGFVVMRSRTIDYPDGTRVRSLTPYAPDYDGLD